MGSDARILDFGCGYGRIANQLTLLGYKHVTGADPSSAMIARGQEIFPCLDLVQAPEGKLPFDDESFDAVVACAVFTCITIPRSRAAAIFEICRIVKPGGLFHLVEFCAEASYEFESTLGLRMRHSSSEELRTLLNPLRDLSYSLREVETISGRPARSFLAFARKSINEEIYAKRV